MKNFKKTISDFEKEKKNIRKLSELKDTFKDKKELQKIVREKDKVIYETFTKSFSPIKLTLTVANPGKIHGEFYLTKGHIHRKQTPEFYILLEGKGDLFIQRGLQRKTIKLKLGEIALIPEGFAHRLINTGKTKLKVLTIYHEDSKPDYNINFKGRFFG